jgi:conjugative relaxase-like TrwC/TraI family protein
MVSGDTVKAGKLETYYNKDDYYFPQDEQSINVLGSGAKIFGFDKLKVSKKKAFARLVEGREVKAFDLTFSAPKSVSIIFAVGNEKSRQIAVEAQRKAVADTFRYIEDQGFFQVVKKENGVVKSYRAEGMLALPIEHSLSRGLDPQLHIHGLIANAGKIPGEDQVRAVNFQILYRNQKHFDLIYKSILRAELEKAGIRTRTTKDGFELSAVTREQIETFSCRSMQIQKNLAAMGLSRETANGEQRQRATLQGRTKKEDVAPEQLRASWEMTAEELDVEFQEIQCQHIQEEETEGIEQLHEALVREAVENHLGTCATTTGKEMVVAILRHASVAAQDEENLAARTLSIQDVMKRLPRELKRRNLFRMPGQDSSAGDYLTERLVSAELLKAETENRQFLLQGKGIFPAPLEDIEVSLDEVAKRIFPFEFKGEQRDAALGILRSQDFLVGVQGDPGTGKTTLLQAVAETFGRDRILAMAVNGAAAKKMSDETGMKASTVARFFIDVDNYKAAIADEDSRALARLAYIGNTLRPGSLLVIDEASMLCSEDANKLCRMAREFGARIVLTGDRYQLPGVAAGKPFETWQDEGMQTFFLKKIRRQRNELELAAVKAITEQHDAQRAVRILQEGKCVAEIKSEEDRAGQIVREYMEEVLAGNYHPLLITGTNKSKDTFNSLIRKQLKDEGRICREGFTFRVSNSQNQESQKEFVAGDRVVFLRNEGKLVEVRDALGKALSKDEKKVFNSDQAEIESINSQGQVTAWLLDEEGRRTSRMATWFMADYQFVDHSYALSTYKSQGQSVERLVMYHAPSNSPLLSKNEFLVGISRNKNNVRIYTDNAAKMAERADHWVHKEEALRLFHAGVEQELGGSEWVSQLAMAAEKRNDRENEILAQRALLVEQFGQFSKAHRETKNRINEALAASREAFHADLQYCHSRRPAEGNMTGLELIAAKWIDGWRVKTKQEGRKFSADKSPARFTNHYRRQNKIDGFVADYLQALTSRGELDQEAMQILADLERIDSRQIFESINTSTQMQDWSYCLRMR